MTEYAFFPGCIGKNVYPGIEKATRLVFGTLDVDLKDYPYSCCPPPGVVACYDKESWYTIGARNLALSEAEDLDIMTICAGCYGTLHNVWHELTHNRKLLEKVNENLDTIGMHYSGKSRPIHFVDILDGMRKEISEKKEIDLGFDVAVHYGCHYLKPSSVTGENPESPSVLDDIVGLVGCRSIEFKDRLTCCGAGGGVMSGEPDLSLRMIETKLKNIQERNVDAIINICSFCHMQFDQSQKKLKRFEIPILHLNQLLGLAFGHKQKHLGLHMNLVSNRDLVKKVKMARRVSA
ncbi:MAG TPA: CoB--CoM heterodisulfide reductase iron-sulfur subunit B family protein [Candidatus Methanofastidiosa archaeon]|nr:CoB--CoM heterodisulfide reductase iron-sulfur subunit B family protein [Candidatus Methanofastidiosa archaeon]HPR41785.1 CoB--CoM heterodisulfide reductase iron-sulfur subunit B family protein [Candidatus Methanofastidiosa archaeon]